MIDQHKAEPSSSVPSSSKNVAGSITPKPEPEPQALQPTPPNSVGQEAAVKNAVGGAVVKEESSGKHSTTIGVPSKAVTENVPTGKKKMGATGGVLPWLICGAKHLRKLRLPLHQSRLPSVLSSPVRFFLFGFRVAQLQEPLF